MNEHLLHIAKEDKENTVYMKRNTNQYKTILKKDKPNNNNNNNNEGSLLKPYKLVCSPWNTPKKKKKKSAKKSHLTNK